MDTQFNWKFSINHLVQVDQGCSIIKRRLYIPTIFFVILFIINRILAPYHCLVAFSDVAVGSKYAARLGLIFEVLDQVNHLAGG
jgi:hypothetical protein